MLAPWTPSSAEGRWAALGPYYAMFPIEFARSVVDRFCPAGGRVLDPFCGRGTVPFVSMVSGRQAVGVDLNPVAWVYATTKTQPSRSLEVLNIRLEQILGHVTAEDRRPANSFQELAWNVDVLGFLNAARRELDWKGSAVDRTLMAVLLVYLHAKAGGGLSNQMRQSKSMAPDYSVRWWKARNFVPPRIDVSAFIRQRLEWRYAKGLPQGRGAATIHLGDARKKLRRTRDHVPFDFVFTSPPYCGVTNYEYDNWIRLWLLGGPALPTWESAQRYDSKVRYVADLTAIFLAAKRLSSDKARVYTRTDARPFTCATTLDVLTKTWPEHEVYGRMDISSKASQTALFGGKQRLIATVSEVDFVLLPQNEAAPGGYFKVGEQDLAFGETIIQRSVAADDTSHPPTPAETSPA